MLKFKLVRTIIRLLSIKPLRQFVVKLVLYYKNDKKYDNKELLDLAVTLLELFGVKVTVNQQSQKSTQINVTWL